MQHTLKIVALGLIAFAFGTAAGVLFGKLMCVLTHGKVNPLIGSAGVSAVPMAARVSQKVGCGSRPYQLPSDACDGTQRSRCYRNRCCGRYLHGNLRSILSSS